MPVLIPADRHAPAVLADAGEPRIVVLVEFELERLERPASEDGEQLALEHGRLLLPPIAIDSPFQQYDRRANAHILLGNLGHLGKRRLPIGGVPRRPIVTADGLEGFARGVAGLARFHLAIAQFLHFFGDRLVLGRDGIQVDARALDAQFCDR